MSDATVKCWGNNLSGNLGAGDHVAHAGPVTAIGVSNAASLMTGQGNNFCAILTDHTMMCWGSGILNAFGDGLDQEQDTPVASGFSDVLTAAGFYYERTWVVKTDGTVWYAGDGISTAVGGDQLTTAPVTTTGVGTGSNFGCLIGSDTNVYCWGYNYQGQLGFTPDDQYYFDPVQITGVTGAVQVVGGTQHACALLADSTVKCWGHNSDGELGIGDTLYQFTPISSL
jgi:alpha-tubulin suppressor-like RCC1 family protein